MCAEFALLILVVLAASPVDAQPASPADTIARQVWERPASEGRVGTMHFRLVAASGAVRERQATMLHSDRPDAVRLAIFFQRPAAIANTAFLSHDNRGRPDETWLFLPATERVRRIPSSQRSEAFLGTDLTYGDLKDNFRFSPEDWTFGGGETRPFRGRPHIWLTGRARTPAIARETGYSAFRALVDPDTLFPIFTEYDDREGRPLKRVEIHSVEKVGQTWTAMRFTATNLGTRHRTEVHFTDMRQAPGLRPAMFAAERLPDGPPAIR
jgi:hypothetical protein